MPHQLTVNVLLANAPADQLCRLRPEVQDQDGLLLQWTQGIRGEPGKDCLSQELQPIAVQDQQANLMLFCHAVRSPKAQNDTSAAQNLSYSSPSCRNSMYAA